MADDPARYVELFAPVASVRVKRMFGGIGIWAGEGMIGLVADGVLYLKTDAATRPAFEAAGGRPFVYEGNGRRTQMSYWTPPDAFADDEAERARWTELARRAASSAGVRRPSGSKRSRPR